MMIQQPHDGALETLIGGRTNGLAREHLQKPLRRVQPVVDESPLNGGELWPPQLPGKLPHQCIYPMPVLKLHHALFARRNRQGRTRRRCRGAQALALCPAKPLLSSPPDPMSTPNPTFHGPTKHGWWTANPPQDGSLIIAIGRVIWTDEMTTGVDRFIEEVQWLTVDGYSGWHHSGGDAFEPSLAVATSLTDDVRIDYWMPSPRA